MSLIRSRDTIGTRERMEVLERSKIRGEEIDVNGHGCKCEGCGEGGKDVYSMLNMVTKLLGGNGGMEKVDGGGRDDVDDDEGLDGFYVDDEEDDGEARGLRRSSNSSNSYGSSNDSDGEFDYLLDEVEIESPMEAQVKKLLASEHDAISNLHRFGYDGSPIQFSSPTQVAKFLPTTLSSNRVLTELQPLSELLPDNHTVIHVYDRTEVADAVVDYALIGVSKFFRGTRFVRIDGDVLTGSTGTTTGGGGEGGDGGRVNLTSWFNSNTTTQARGILVLKGTQVIKFEPNATVYTSGSEPGNVAGKLEMIIGELHTESIHTDVHADDVFKEVKEEVLGLEYGVRKWLGYVGIPPSEDGVQEYVKKACAEINKSTTKTVRKTKVEDDDDDVHYCDVEGCGKMFQHTHVGTGVGEGMVDLGGV
jgi:hypothetical protein